MKRFFILISCILLIVSLSISAFAAGLDWQDFVVSTTPGIEYDIRDVFIPGSAIPISWERYGVWSSTGQSCSFTQTETSVFSLNIRLFDAVNYLSVSGLDSQDSIDLHFRFSDSKLPNLVNCYYYWTDGNGNVSTVLAESYVNNWNYTAFVDLTTKPDNAVGLSFFIGVRDSALPAGDYTIECLGISFDVIAEPSGVFNPMIIEPQDYIVNESSNGDTSTLYVSVPSSDLAIRWNTLRNDDFSVLSEFYGNPYNVDLPVADYGYWIGCQVFDKLDITDIVNGSVLNVKFDIEIFDLDTALEQPLLGAVRYQVRYYDSSGAMLDTVKFFTVPDADWFTDTSLDVVIDKPAGAVAMTFICQFMDISLDREPVDFSLDLESVNFVCDIPTMVRVQQETGRTNKLLEEIKDGWEPDPSLPPFNDSLQDSLDKEDQIIDQLDPDGVVGDLDDIQVTVLDRILLLANSFQMISLMFQAFLKVPVLEVVAYVSLLLGLLASLLGIGMAAGRAVSRREARSGKKGK